MKRPKVFTIIEILVMVFILTIIVSIFIKWQISRNDLVAAKIYADATKGYARLFMEYLKKNKQSILKQVNPNNPLVISITDLQSQGYLSAGSSLANLFNQKACLLVMQNPSSNILYPILFYVDGRSVESTIVTRAMTYIGGMSGVYDKASDNVLGLFGFWSYNNFYSNFQGLINHCGNVVANNSLVFNIGMDNVYNDAITPDISLHRFTDLIESNLGELGNTNTVYSDITLTNIESNASKKLYFDESKNIYFVQDDLSNPNVNLKNGTLAADGLLPLNKKAPGASCNAAQLGSISAQVDSSYGMQASTLICSYNPPVCQAQANNDYCYMPIKHNTIKFTNTGNMTSTFICPAAVPNVSDVSAGIGYINIQYQECSYDPFLGYNCNGTVQNSPVPVSSGTQFLNSPVIVDGNSYLIKVGYQVTNNYPNLNSCGSKCSALNMNERNIRDYPYVRNASCACNGNNKRVVSILSTTPLSTAKINYVTCTSKLILIQR